ncbi:multiple epidermal growth factor-like domains protein 10 [Drosophila grimshawi]|uniref:multiple epidermal growth factor-like domains protein 10 n=1 Tax=Drosophila grimshawi TaxID=7222 RepID=UPI000C8716A4|nr:multiple epidermal growth factor-like domains protein 10 [Drosophila grimshawi]
MGCTRSHFIWAYLVLAIGFVGARSVQFKNTCKIDEKSSDFINKEMEKLDKNVHSTQQPAYECCPGYSGPIDNCQPICSEGCGDNAYCMSPEICKCLEGHEKVEGGGCEQQKDLHLCTAEVEVDYTDYEPLSMKYFGNVAEEDTKNIDLSNILIPKTKTRLENKTVCCEGYEREDEESPCVLKDPNLCTREVEVDLVMDETEARIWQAIKEDFTKLTIEFPKDLPPTTRMEIQQDCCEGYKRQSISDLCQPVCSTKCVENSVCKKPNTCECLVNYRMGSDGECVRKFKAHDPHVCSREVNDDESDKNRIKDSAELELYCCDGYEQNSTSTLCEPKCSKGCGHNCRCVQPEVCKCEKIICQCGTGYVKGKSGPCEPICTAGCPAHSSCISPDKCGCNEGYKLSNSVCQPICSGAQPEHSSCMRPGEWECDLGYIKVPTVDTLAYSCEPHCSKSCSSFAKCVKPDYCECLPGFTPFRVRYVKQDFVVSCLKDSNPSY